MSAVQASRPTRRAEHAPRRRPRDLRRFLRSNRALVALVAYTTIGSALVAAFPNDVPINSLMVPLVLASLFLPPRQLAGFIAYEMVVMGLAITQQPEFSVRLWAAVGVLYFVAFFALFTSLRRVQLGVGGAEIESMLLDLRDRIQAHGRVPEMPEGWRAEARIAAAGGTRFSGDFLCVSHSDGDRRVDFVLVDVSGKGVAAGTRALQLSGALSGILASVAPERVLGAVNEYLLRQDWEDGFATAVHVGVDLETGEFHAATAGHPPMLRVRADGTVARLDTSGPLLGLMSDPDYLRVRGRVGEGETLVAYTDGLVELPGVDIDAGIDALGAEVTRELAAGFAGAAERVVRGGAADDDRALLLIGRA